MSLNLDKIAKNRKQKIIKFVKSKLNMEKITVRAVDPIESKSKQELEREILAEAEANASSEQPVTTDQDDTVEDENGLEKEVELSEDDVINFIKNKYNTDIESLESVINRSEPEGGELELPEDVSKFLEFKKETGRGLKDFIRVNEDIDSLDDEDILRRYYMDTEKGLDEEDIEDLIKDNFGYDPDLDDEEDIRRINRKKKKEITKAKEHLNSLKEKFSAPLESKVADPSSDEDYLAYKEQVEKAKSQSEQAAKKMQWFKEKTDELFNEEFKGFEFSVDDKKFTFPIGNVEESRDKQKDLGNFIGKFLDENGMMKDAVGYHKALSMAMNPEAYAKFFYEQGVADAVTNDAKESKNITIDKKRSPESSNVGKTTIRSVSSDSGKGLRIR